MTSTNITLREIVLQCFWNRRASSVCFLGSYAPQPC